MQVLCRELDGSERIHSTLKEGSWFGEVSLIKHIERTASVRSITPCQLFRLDQATFNKVPQHCFHATHPFSQPLMESAQGAEVPGTLQSYYGLLGCLGLSGALI